MPAPPPAGCMLFSILLTITMVTIPLGLTILWICMIVYCLKYQKKDRTAWIIVNFLCGPFGSIIYFFFKEPKMKKIADEQQVTQ